jgi:hypothetical protein
MRWLDSRVYKPSSKATKIYPVVFKLLENSEITSVGYATWSPINDYTDGRWTNVEHNNGADAGDDALVLYWMEIKGKPETV